MNELEAKMSQSVTTVDMVKATANALNAWDKELNKIYALLLQKLSAEDIEKLRTEQRLWIKERDKERLTNMPLNLKEEIMKKFFTKLIVIMLVAIIMSFPVLGANKPAPITIAAELSRFNIGYCSYEASPLTIKETYAGALKQGTEIRISLTDLFYINDLNSISIESDTLKIRTKKGAEDATKKIIGSDNSEYEYKDYLSIMIDKESTNVPSTITVSNIHPKIDRTASGGTMMNILVFGTAIDTVFHYDETSEHALVLPYIEIVVDSFNEPIIPKDTPTADFFIDKDYYIVDGQKHYIDTRPYIDAESGHIMIPLKHALTAMGIPDESIIWDEKAQTLAINTGGRFITYTVNNDVVIVNGLAMPIVADGKPRIVPIIKNERVFIPFRSLGEVLDFPVRWNENKKMISLNTYME